MNELAECRHGKMLYNVHDIYVGRSLKLYGEFSEGECEVFRQVVRPGWTVLELGANIGAHTVCLAKLVGPRGRVIALEPQRVVFQTLCANVALNNLQNVDCRHLAAGEISGSVIMPRMDYTQEFNFAGISVGLTKEGEQVQLTTIDELELPACHFIKLDIEGMEREAIQGATKTINRFKPFLYVENDRPDRSDSLIQSIYDLGYRMYWHLPALFSPSNYAGNSENVFGRTVSKNMLCVHKSIQHSVAGPEVSIPVGRLP